MVFGQQDHIKSKRDKTQVEEKKTVEVLETLGLKMTGVREMARRQGIYCREGMRRPVNVTFKMGGNNEGVLRQTYQLADSVRFKRVYMKKEKNKGGVRKTQRLKRAKSSKINQAQEANSQRK